MIGHVYVKGERVERPLGFDHKTGLAFRKDTADQRTIAEIERSYGWLDVENKVVLDIGAHIGSFSKWAHSKGAQQIYAVEPDDCNRELLKKNVPFNNVAIIPAAAVGLQPIGGKTMLYYTRRGFSHGMNSTQQFQGRIGIEVNAVAFHDLILHYRPDVVKIDCEGGEYDFLPDDDLPDCVKQVAIEIHFSKKEWRTRLGPELIKSFSDWETIVEPKVGTNNWTTVAGWRRG